MSWLNCQSGQMFPFSCHFSWINNLQFLVHSVTETQKHAWGVGFKGLEVGKYEELPKKKKRKKASYSNWEEKWNTFSISDCAAPVVTPWESCIFYLFFLSLTLINQAEILLQGGGSVIKIVWNGNTLIFFFFFFFTWETKALSQAAAARDFGCWTFAQAEVKFKLVRFVKGCRGVIRFSKLAWIQLVPKSLCVYVHLHALIISYPVDHLYKISENPKQFFDGENSLLVTSVSCSHNVTFVLLVASKCSTNQSQDSNHAKEWCDFIPSWSHQCYLLTKATKNK